MGFHVPSFVGHDGSQVGHVQWGGEEFALPNADGVDGPERPVTPAVEVVVVRGVWHQSESRAGDVSPQVRPQSKVLDAFGPPPQPEPRVVEFVLVWMLVDHAAHDLVEVGIAAVDHRAPQVVLGVGPMTANDVAVAVDVGARRDGSLLHGDQPLDHFENGARPVGAAHGPVVEGFPRVFGQTVVSRTPTRARQQVPVVGGR